MNYAGFTRPVWQWLKASGPVPFEPGPFTALPSFPGGAVASAMRSFAAAQPWRATAHGITLVDSHDTVRIRTLLRDPGLVSVAFGFPPPCPESPCCGPASEIGQEGVNGEDARRPIPWDNPEQWDMDRFAFNEALFRARAENVALRRGGLRWLAVQDDSITFLRESPEQTILIHAARAQHHTVKIPSWTWGISWQGWPELQICTLTHRATIRCHRTDP